MKTDTTLKIRLVAAIVALLSLASCTDHFEDLNKNVYTASNEELAQGFSNLSGEITTMQNSVYLYSPVWQTQLQENLNADVYSGYMMSPSPFQGNTNNMNYSLVAGWNGFPWSVAYQKIMSSALRVEQLAKEKYPFYYAWALVHKVFAMSRVTDKYGPIIYSNFGTDETTISYDSQESVYNQFFKDLDEAVAELTKKVAVKNSEIASSDLTKYKGDYSKWIKFANSLRLRLAIRISKVSPKLAKTEAEKAVSNPTGLIEENSDNAIVSNPSYKHPLFTMSNAWNDTRMGAPMESFLLGYNDSRIAVYFSTTAKGDYKGIRQGIAILEKAQYQGFSALGEIINTSDIVWMTAAEVSFLRAEGILRGWNMGGSAESFYNKGIELSFEQNKVSGIEEYKQNDTATPKTYIDSVNPSNNIGDTDISNITIKWNANDTNERKLERIITQKWIAIFPDGQEAWSEFRRTGYPKLFPVVINNSRGAIDTDIQIRRLEFSQTEKDNNAAGLATGLKALGGPDTGGTRLWWDTGSSNF